ncbi:Down syndrome critical region protein 3 isoform X3 [Numida meleagris]|uniref:Down syndrome critical region protein 3 isoform X3 n=1 Tax=Numida meleagris TaxID=8996 RepID=UPI000B3DECAB|nr:Down syndrome critical region protein 3 isoform X3 [Numida meleagris]
MGTALDIKIKRANKVYRCGEILSGVVVITSKDTVQHQGISLTMEGSVNLQLSAKSVGVFEAFYNSVKPIQIINSTIEMVKPGKLPSGKTEIPFEFPLHVKGNKVLYETYHGVFVNIQYTLRCDMRRSLLAKDLTKTCEFIVHSLSQKGKLTPSPVDFTITPETLQNVKEGVRKVMPEMPQRYRIFRLLMEMSAEAYRFQYTWCSPGCSLALPWKQQTSKLSLK